MYLHKMRGLVSAEPDGKVASCFLEGGTIFVAVDKAA